jgi:outer membrane lipoprotein carrier protein
MMIKIPTWLCFSFALSLLSVPAAVLANALLEFSDTLKSFRANFTQTVYDSDSVVLQESTGVVVLARPGRFKWTYDAPVNQVIVADGLTLWVFDEEIKQVTKQPQSTTLGSAPIGLLSGQRDIESEFVVTELGQKDNLEWFQLQPLVSDTDFNEIFLALRDGGLHAMELRDNFDQATQIVFDNFEKNLVLDSDQFTFVVPDGVDVVGEGGVPEVQDELLNDESPADDLPSVDDNRTDDSRTDEEQGGVSQSDTELPQSTEQTDVTPSQDDTTVPATTPEAVTPAATDPLLVDDSDPLPDNIGQSESQITAAPSASDAKQTSVSTAPPAPNSDEDLLSDAEPAEDIDVSPAADSDQSPADSTVTATDDETQSPAINTADPSREITFEERKVTD